MLQVSYIREHQAEVIERLSKRTNDAKSLIDDVIKLDESRRGLQTQVDSISSELNVISKEIGELFKSHRAHASTTIIAQFFQENKCFGNLLSQEIESIDKVMQTSTICPSIASTICASRTRDYS